jgi:hypothetical protein
MLMRRTRRSSGAQSIDRPRPQTADELVLYHHYEMNYTPPDAESGRRLIRR